MASCNILRAGKGLISITWQDEGVSVVGFTQCVKRQVRCTNKTVIDGWRNGSDAPRHSGEKEDGKKLEVLYSDTLQALLAETLPIPQTLP